MPPSASMRTIVTPPRSLPAARSTICCPSKPNESPCPESGPEWSCNTIFVAGEPGTESGPAERSIDRRLYRSDEGFSCSDERIPRSDDRADSPLDSVGRSSRFRPPPTPQLNLGGEYDPHRIGFLPWNPQHPMRLQLTGLSDMTKGAATCAAKTLTGVNTRIHDNNH